jgi:hypothetical protein
MPHGEKASGRLGKAESMRFPPSTKRGREESYTVVIAAESYGTFADAISRSSSARWPRTSNVAIRGGTLPMRCWGTD